MTNKQAIELELVERLLNVLGYQNFKLKPGNNPGKFPDVIAILNNNRAVGIEVTEFHADEPSNHKGSKLREEEKKKAKASAGGSYAMCGQPNYLPALQVRIANKVNVTRKFDSTGYNEFWLLIASQLPQLGGLASTFMVSALVDLNALNNSFHEMLLKSHFGAVYLHLLMERTIFEWSPSKKWCRVITHR